MMANHRWPWPLVINKKSLNYNKKNLSLKAILGEMGELEFIPFGCSVMTCYPVLFSIQQFVMTCYPVLLSSQQLLRSYTLLIDLQFSMILTFSKKPTWRWSR